MISIYKEIIGYSIESNIKKEVNSYLISYGVMNPFSMELYNNVNINKIVLLLKKRFNINVFYYP